MQTASANQTRGPKRDRAAYMRRYRARRRERQAAARAALTPAKKYSADADGVIKWCEDRLVVPTGTLQGQPIRLAEYQRRIIRALVDGGYSEVWSSQPRKGAKSMTVALCAASVLFPGAPLSGRKRFRIIVISLTGRHAQEVRTMVMQLAASAPDLAEGIELRKAPAPGWIEGVNENRCEFWASDKNTSHSIRSDWIIADEAGLYDPQAGRTLVDNAYSSMSTSPYACFIGISVRGTSGLVADAAERAKSSDAIFFEEHRADDSVRSNLFDEDQWHKANPSIKAGFKSLDYMRRAAERAASGGGGAENAFLSLDLNLPVSDSLNSLVPASAWLRCENWDDGQPVVPRGRLVAGLDLGGSRAMSAFVVVEVDGEKGRPSAIYARGGFPGEPSLAERSKHDNCPGLYEDMEAGGELFCRWPGPVLPVRDFLAACIAELSAMNGGDFDLLYVGCDRYRKAEAAPVIAGLTQRPPVWRGQGASARADGSHDVNAATAAILSGAVVSPRSKLIQSGLAYTHVRHDQAGNPALIKSSGAGGRGRNDIISALVIALGIRAILKSQPQGGGVTNFVVR